MVPTVRHTRPFLEFNFAAGSAELFCHPHCIVAQDFIAADLDEQRRKSRCVPAQRYLAGADPRHPYASPLYDMALYVGTAGGSLNVANGNSVIDGRAGNETINAGNGADVVAAGTNDAITLGNGQDVVTGGANDTIQAGNGSDSISTGANSRVTVGNGSDTVAVGDNSTVTLGGGQDTVTAGANATIIGGNGNDTVTTGTGSKITLGGGNDTVTPGSNSTVTLGNGNNTVFGGQTTPSPSETGRTIDLADISALPICHQVLLLARPILTPVLSPGGISVQSQVAGTNGEAPTSVGVSFWA